MTGEGDEVNYQAARARLVERVKELKNQRFDSTAAKKRATLFADRLRSLATDLEMDNEAALWDVEDVHDEAAEFWGGNFKTTLRYMKDLAESFDTVVSKYPDPRKKFALPAAALGLVALWYEHGRPRPSMYVGGPAVKELSELCSEAGLALGEESYKAALSRAISDFDPHFKPPWVHHVLTGSWDW